MAADGTGGTGRRLVLWWVASVVAGIVVVACGVWLVARPHPGSATPSAADRPGQATVNGSASISSAAPTARASGGAPSGGATSGGAGARPGSPSSGTSSPRHGGATAPAQPAPPAPPAPTVRSQDAGEGPTQQAGATEQQGQPVRLPGVPPAPHVGRWLVSRPLPANAQAHGRLVAGYPSAVLPTPRWVHVRRSSVASHGTTVQVTLQARTGRHASALLEHYRSALIARGFGVFPAPALGTQQAETFTRRADSVVVTVDPRRSTYSLYAVLHAAPHR